MMLNLKTDTTCTQNQGNRAKTVALKAQKISALEAYHVHSSNVLCTCAVFARFNFVSALSYKWQWSHSIVLTLLSWVKWHTVLPHAVWIYSFRKVMIFSKLRFMHKIFAEAADIARRICSFTNWLQSAFISKVWARSVITPKILQWIKKVHVIAFVFRACAWFAWTQPIREQIAVVSMVNRSQGAVCSRECFSLPSVSVPLHYTKFLKKAFISKL